MINLPARARVFVKDRLSLLRLIQLASCDSSSSARPRLLFLTTLFASAFVSVVAGSHFPRKKRNRFATGCLQSEVDITDRVTASLSRIMT